MKKLETGGTIADRFAAAVARKPDAVAVRSENTEITYRELDALGSELADRLAGAGIPRGSLIGLQLSRSANIPIAVLGVFKHGCAYVPVDPAQPAARRSFIVRDSGAVAMLVEEAGGLRIDRLEPVDGAAPPAGLAYVIYTSGSTGTPKGVQVGHQHVLALLNAVGERFRFGPADVWTLFSSYGFDVSVWEMWGALLSGGRLVVVSADRVRNPAAFAALLEDEGVTVLNQVPTAFTYLVRALEARRRRLHRLRYVILAGESINPASIRRWWRLRLAPDAVLVNMYGPTEVTVLTTYQELTPANVDGWDGHTPIGTPLAHLRIELQDESGGAVPTGEPGEIVVTGGGVAWGYVNRPRLTAERFVRDEDGTIVSYRSGDWARRNAAGDLFYIGRRDNQIQLRGFRVELGEIEARMADHPAVAECVVTAPLGSAREPVLTAHVVVDDDTVGVRELRQHATASLPPYMVPMRFVLREGFPMTPNGKVDRRALDAVEAAR